MINNKISEYFKLAKEIHDAFGYVEDWVTIPMEDSRECYWYIKGTDESGDVIFAMTKELLCDEESEEYYSNEIYTQRFLPKYVYRTKELTMISVNTHTDGNRYLQIFDNAKEINDI